jgi:hypothetical protein
MHGFTPLTVATNATGGVVMGGDPAPDWEPGVVAFDDDPTYLVAQHMGGFGVHVPIHEFARAKP